MIATELQQVLSRAAELPPDEQQAVAARFQQVLDTFLDEHAHPVFTDEVAWMKHLGMSDEDIAWVLAQPTNPEPGEAYVNADA